MCLTEPCRVVAVDDQGTVATVERGGVRRPVLLAVLAADGERVSAGDWVLVNAGVAVARVEDDEALELRGIVRQARLGPRGGRP